MPAFFSVCLPCYCRAVAKQVKILLTAFAQTAYNQWFMQKPYKFYAINRRT